MLFTWMMLPSSALIETEPEKSSTFLPLTVKEICLESPSPVSVMEALFAITRLTLAFSDTCTTQLAESSLSFTPLETVTLIVVVPGPTAFTRPSSSTVATSLSELDHFTSPAEALAGVRS